MTKNGEVLVRQRRIKINCLRKRNTCMEGVLRTKCVLSFSPQLFPPTFLALKNFQRLAAEMRRHAGRSLCKAIVLFLF